LQVHADGEVIRLLAVGLAEGVPPPFFINGDRHVHLQHQILEDTPK
jgi:hypothetical protein